jgi:hypothetical protein
MNLIVVAIALVQLTGPDGKQRIDINPAEITSIREPSGPQQTVMAKGTHCVIVMTSSKFVAVHEDCATVRMRIGGLGHSPCTLVCAGERP